MRRGGHNSKRRRGQCGSPEVIYRGSRFLEAIDGRGRGAQPDRAVDRSRYPANRYRGRDYSDLVVIGHGKLRESSRGRPIVGECG